MKKIEFILAREEYHPWIDKPIPSIKNLPSWYKNMKLHHSEYKNEYEKSDSLTIKNCVPFMDVISFGYHIPLPHDIEVQYDKYSNVYNFFWKVNDITPLQMHKIEQTYGLEIPPGFDLIAPMKWINPWLIKTPKGYSCMFITPQMHNLPFYCIPGIVDTDTFNLPVNFPFFIKEGFNGVIKKGTPIIQVFPFKRDSWTAISDKTDYSVKTNSRFLQSTFTKAYKKFFWNKKIFK